MKIAEDNIIPYYLLLEHMMILVGTQNVVAIFS